MSLRDKLGMFVLTREEQRTIAFIVLAIVLGLVTEHYRHRRPARPGSPNDTELVSPVLASPIPKTGYAKHVPPEERAAARPEPPHNPNRF
jgi:hypothetical protein